MTDIRSSKTVVTRQILLPPKNSDCPCGSGEKFKRCCADRLPGQNIGKQARTFLDAKDYKNALLACRADITQYTIWHKTHTDPLLRSTQKAIEYLLKLDIRALAEMIELLEKCYRLTDKADDFGATLERLRSNINDPRWHRKIIYLQAMHALSPTWNIHAGQRELKKLGSMDSETDVETLQLYVDLFHEELNFAAKQKFMERIILLTESPVEKLHYRCAKAVELLLIGDKRGAEEELIAALEAYKSSGGNETTSLYARHRYAMALNLLGKLKNDQQVLDQATTICTALLEEPDWSDAGRAAILWELGDVLRFKKNWSEARDVYRKAYDIQKLPIFQIFLSECLLETDGWEIAAETIRSVIPTDLEKSELADYVFTFALVAIQGGDKDLLSKAETLLRHLNIPAPHFRERRDSLLIEVLATQRSGKSNASTNNAKTLVRSMTSRFLRYVKLEPNFMGIGLNLGKIIEDLSKSEQEHSRSKADNVSDSK